MNQQPQIMKTQIISFIGAVAVMSISSCTTVVETPVTPLPQPNVTTTTTERSSLNHPTVGTMETKTTRTY